MKHLLLILTFVASTVVVKAQTKDETIAWIKEMLEKAGEYNGSHYTNVQVSPCSIRFRQVYDDKNKPDYYDISFNPSKVMTWDIRHGSSNLYSDSDVIKYMSYSSDGKYQTTFYFGYLQLNNIESNFYERMIKALLHLETFCENTKETF